MSKVTKPHNHFEPKRAPSRLTPEKELYGDYQMLEQRREIYRDEVARIKDMLDLV